MNASQNSSLGSAPSALLTWLKNYYYYIIDLKNRTIGNEHITNDSRHFRFVFGPVNKQIVPLQFVCLKNLHLRDNDSLSFVLEITDNYVRSLKK